MNAMDWWGWSETESKAGLHIGPLPGRKRIALYGKRQGTIRALAYFRSEEHAREALELLDIIAKAGIAIDPEELG